MHIYCIVIRNIESESELRRKPFAWVGAHLDIRSERLESAAAVGDVKALSGMERDLTTLVPTGISAEPLPLEDIRSALAHYRNTILAPSIVIYVIDGMRMETGFFGAHVTLRSENWPKPKFPSEEATLEMFRFGWRSLIGGRSRAQFIGNALPGSETGLVRDALEMVAAAELVLLDLCKR